MMYGYKITEEYVTNYRSIPSSDFVPERIGSVGDLIESQNNHYFLVNGRYIAHVLVQIFCCWLGPVAFAFCNVAVWILLICLLLKTSGVNTSDWKFWLMTIILVVFTYLFKMVPSTEIGYVWMSAANLLFLSFLFRRGMSGWWTVPLILFSLIVGNGNETFSSGISMALIYYLIKHGRSLSLQKWLMIAAYGAGAIFLIASPGSWHRIGDTETQHGMGLLIVLTVGLPTTLILLSVVTYLCLTGKEKIQILFKDNIFYWIAFGFCLIFCIATGAPSIRSLCGTNLMAIVLLFFMTLNVCKEVIRKDYTDLSVAQFKRLMFESYLASTIISTYGKSPASQNNSEDKSEVGSISGLAETGNPQNLPNHCMMICGSYQI